MLKRRRHTHALLALLCGVLAVPASAGAASGGAGLSAGASGSTGSGVAPSPSMPAPQSGDVTVSAAGNGVTLSARASAILRRGLSFSGTAPGAAGDTLEIERSGRETNWQWAPTVQANVSADGSFTAVWSTNHIGRFAIRAVLSAPSGAQAASVTESLTVTVYRPSLATQYGPGFYGDRTACGQKLTTGMIGVANRTLKCGTKVAIYYHGQTIVVPVIDRGPYANGADWDLTEATARTLGIDGSATIGAVSLPVG